MTARADSAKAIFLDCIEKHAPEAWPAFLDEACAGDAELRSQVEKLLRASRELGTFHERTSRLIVTEAPGSVIGPYKLLEQIGEGGMGLVFMAEQTEPIRRKVALKIIKPGMDTRQVVARFEAERQALALMDHPNIAKILEAGLANPAREGGGEGENHPRPYGQGSPRPFFVMELVRGIPITEFCDTQRYTPKQRLALFVTVCQAVQHAHQKGIIHRDLKPSNILVTLHDTVAVPKIIDFGIAKALDQRLTEQTLFTNFAQMIGTPVYMSPEQAEMNGLDADTRSDVYALGVLLYELLTGTTPFDSQTLKQAGFDEMRRLIREEDPPRPSQRVSTLEAAALTTLSERRGVDGRRFGQSLRGDLDWIVMKALEKDRNRRYESAGALAADVKRHLDVEPILAKPPGWRGKIAKWGRRHRALVGSAVAVLVFAVLALSVSTWLIAKERDNARREKQAADERLAFARQVVKTMYVQVAEKWLEDEPQLEKFQLETLQSAAEFFQQFAKETATSPDMKLEQGTVLSNLAVVFLKLEHFDDAVRYGQQSVEVLRSLCAEQPANDSYLAALALAYHDCARCLKQANRHAEAEQHFREALRIRRSLVQAKPGDELFRTQLQASLGSLADALPKDVAATRESEQLFREAIDLGEALLTESDGAAPRNNLTATLNNFALQLLRQRRFPEARGAFKRAIELSQVNLTKYPRKRTYREHLANQLRNLATLEYGLENYSAVEECFKEALAVRDRLAEDFPNVPLYGRQRIEAKIGVGVILARNGNVENAERTLKDALAAITELVGRFPTQEHRRILALAHSELSERYREDGHFSLAEQHRRESIDIVRAELAAANATPESNARFHDLSGGLHNLAMILFAQERHAEAIETQREAIRLQEAVVKAYGATNFVYRMYLRNQKASLARYLVESPEPLRDLDGALNAAKEALTLDPKYDMAIFALGRAQFRMGDYLSAIGTLENRHLLSKSDRASVEVERRFLLSMCYCQLADFMRSTLLFAAGDQLLSNGKLKSHQRPRLDNLRTEAALLLGIDLSKPEPPARGPDSL